MFTNEDRISTVAPAIKAFAAAIWVDELGPEAFIEIHASCNGEVWHTQTGEDRAALISTYPL